MLSNTGKIMGVLFLLIVATTLGYPMNLNMAVPWGDTCSPPQNPYLSFYSADSENMLFTRGKVINIICQSGLRSVGLRWSLHRNMITKSFRDGTADAMPANRFRICIDTAGLIPGFYDIRVELNTGLDIADKNILLRRPVKGVCSFGWKATEMAIADTRPADFNKFWGAAKDNLARIPLDAHEGPLQQFTGKEINDYNVTGACLPPDYDPKGHRTEQVESGKVDFAGPDGGRVYGWLAKPVGKGPFPAMLVLPGAGFNARPRPLEHARHGYVAMDIQIHGQDVDLKEYPKLPGYYADQKYDNPADYYYYNVHLRCLQAVNYLISRPDVDPKRIMVVGGSQGGRLGIVVAGLDSRIKAVVSAIPNSPNHPHLHWVARCNGYAQPGDMKPDPKIALNDGMDVKGAPPLFNDAADRCMAYYDPMNFSPDIKSAVLVTGGLIDPASPPYSVWAVYKRIGAKNKKIAFNDGLGHDWSAEFDRRAWQWLETIK